MKITKNIQNQMKEINTELLTFIDDSPCSFHAVSNITKMLDKNKFIKLEESKPWSLSYGKSYYVTRNNSAVIAFKIPAKSYDSYNIIASHSDSPIFKIKPNAEIVVENKYTKLNIEKYGGMILSPWLDRPLSVAGRVIIDDNDKIITKLVNIDKDLLIIPNLAIHMNREINDGYKLNLAKDMPALLGENGAYKSFMELIAKKADTTIDNIIDTDLYLYSRTKGVSLGINEEYIASGRLDDLQCAFSSIKSLINAKPSKSLALSCIFDNEEVGSVSKQGAGSTFLKDTLKRINFAFGKSKEEYYMNLSSSFMISADNAHGVHPNHTDKCDQVNRPYLNEGIVIKYNANQKYTTDAVSAAIFKKICKSADVPYQIFVNRSDMAGGSTLGNISSSQVSINTVDIGLAQLSMHSPYETAGSKDTYYLVKAGEVFFSSNITAVTDGEYKL